MAAEGRIRPGKNYHADEHGVSSVRIVGALYRCVEVKPDHRTDLAGNLRHAEGYIAYGRIPPAQTIRVDFDLEEDEDGPYLAVETAFPVNP